MWWTVSSAGAGVGKSPSPYFDSLWGERSDLANAAATSIGNWGMILTGHGIEHLSFGGAALVPRVFFSVRDRSWGSSAIPMNYERAGDRTSPDSRITFHGWVEGYPLQVSGSIEPVSLGLIVSFQLEVGADVEVTRAGPCILHYVLPAGETITTDLPGEAREVEVAQDISSARPISGYRTLSYSVDGTKLTIEFDGGLFEMEDQRNWTDNSFKSYTPPLTDPRPLTLLEGVVLTYRLLFRVGTPAPKPPPPVSSGFPSKLTVRAPDLTSASYSLPGIGVVHPGGPFYPALMSKLSELQPEFVHLVAELGDRNWKRCLKGDLLAVARLGATAVLTVDCPPERRQDLGALAEIGAGRVDTAFLFDSGRALTSDELADAGRIGFDGTGIRVGAGTRGHFASLNLVGRVPDAAEVIGISLAAAAHDDDRRALTTGLGSYSQIFRQVRRMAGDREIYAGPTGFAPTFDSWSALGFELGVREAWAKGHPGARSVFGAAWAVAAIAFLSALGPKRVGISGAINPARGSDLDTNPVLRALGVVCRMRGEPVKVLRSGDRVGGLSAATSSIVAVMTDEAVEMTGLVGPILVICGATELEDGPRPPNEGALPSPSVLSLTTDGYVELVERRGA
jgi:D-apionolactonase